VANPHTLGIMSPDLSEADYAREGRIYPEGVGRVFSVAASDVSCSGGS